MHPLIITVTFICLSFIFLKFPLKGREKEFLLVWTTTPWTLTSNVAAAVNVNLDYVKLQAIDGSIYYFAQDNLEYQRLEKQFEDKKQWVEGVPKLKTIAISPTKDVYLHFYQE